jgi:hypothetical protein
MPGRAVRISSRSVQVADFIEVFRAIDLIPLPTYRPSIAGSTGMSPPRGSVIEHRGTTKDNSENLGFLFRIKDLGGFL